MRWQVVRPGRSRGQVVGRTARSLVSGQVVVTLGSGSRVAIDPHVRNREAIQPSGAPVTVGSEFSLPPSEGQWVYDPATGWTERVRDLTLEEIEEQLRQA